jgi:hypothetical protein
VFPLPGDVDARAVETEVLDDADVVQLFERGGDAAAEAISLGF